MTNLEMRPLEATHISEAAALCQREVAYLPFSTAILKDRILDDPDFDSDLNPTVWQGERLVGPGLRGAAERGVADGRRRQAVCRRKRRASAGHRDPAPSTTLRTG